jgi:hypothetical protein
MVGIPKWTTLMSRKMHAEPAPAGAGFAREEDRITVRPPRRTEMASRQRASKRELINTGKDKRFVRRDSAGRFKESDDVSRSLRQDGKRKAKTASKVGQGDKGDRRR